MMRSENPERMKLIIAILSFIFLVYLIEYYSVILAVMAQSTTTISVNVGVIVDLNNSEAKKSLICINMSVSEFYASHPNYQTRLVLKTRDSFGDVVGAAAAALDLIKNEEVQAIIGPTTSMQAGFVIQLGEKANVPIISYSASSPLTSIRGSYFFRATQNDSTQVNAITAIIQSFGWREAVPVFVNNDFGQGILPYLVDALQAIDTRIPHQSAISPNATDDQIEKELYKLMSMQTRVFIVHMNPSLGSRFFTKAKEIGMMSEGYAWILTDGITDFLNSLAHQAVDSMHGVLGIRPYVPKTKELENFRVRWKRKFLLDNPTDAELNIYGLWAYDAVIALAMAVEKAGLENFGFQKADVSNNPTDLAKLGMSPNGPSIVQALSDIRFNGLTGDFFFVNGHLPASTFQIVNVFGEGAKGLGFWKPEKGLVKNLNSSSHSPSKSEIGSVIWPGDSTSVPKGWEIPTNGKKLKIGVPVKTGFNEFVKVTIDPDTKTSRATGYCILVFEAVVKALPYALTYEYVPFAMPDGTSSGTYDDLIYQVYSGKFDAVVGDITIIYNRSLYVDFTLPYTESGVSMIVPIKDNKHKNAWAFLKPLTWDLWVTSFFFFVFIGFVVWVLEHRINEGFRGPPSHQAGTIFWFSFSTMVFAYRERVVSNLARVVTIIWCFVVLILTQSYTASLASLLTVQQLLPTVTDVNQLIKNGEYVGYQNGSFVLGILKGLGFDESKLMKYNSSEECNELFSKGSGNGGIAAAFDEVPYMKLLLAQHCSKYTMIEPTFKTGGIGFVFPTGSPLVPDISRAILNVTEGDEMKRIEKSVFGNQGNCPDPSTSVSSNSLSMQNFWGLFLIAGIASLLALMIFAAMFVYENRHVLMNSYSQTSIWSRILDLFKTFDHKDLKFHTFRKRERNLSSSMGAPSTSVYSVSTDFPLRQGSLSAELGDKSPNRQPPQEEMLNIELANPEHETPTVEITNENY